MVLVTADITQDCAGAGRLTLTSAQAVTNDGETFDYYWAILDAQGKDYGTRFEPDFLPVVVRNLPNGTYTSTVTATSYRDGATSTSRGFSFTIACGLPLQLVSATAIAATATSNGTITVRVKGGTPPYLAKLRSLSLQQTLTDSGSGEYEVVFVNIPAGSYQRFVSDSTTPDAQTVSFEVTVTPYAPAVVLGCTDPAATNYDPAATQDDNSCVYAPVVRLPYFEVPPMQSLRFVTPGIASFDNTLLADENPLDYTNPGYCQLVEQGDALALQVTSNYAGAPVFKLHPAASPSVTLRTFPTTRVQQGAGRTADFAVYLKADPTTGRTRIYFNEDELPYPFLPGQRVTLAGTGSSLDGTYPLRDVLEDPAAGMPYLVVSKPYPTSAIRLDGTLSTTFKVQAYDTYQAVLDFSTVAPDCYTLSCEAQDADFADALAVSEPVELAAVHAGTLLVSYRNFDNAFGLNYSSGLVNRLRVKGRFFDRLPDTEKTVLRNDDSSLELLQAAAYRKIALEVLLVPGWLHEVLAVAFCHDSVRVQGLAGIVEGKYSYEPVQRYTLGKGTALVESKRFLGSGNNDDLGDIDLPAGGPFLLASDRFLNATSI